MPGWGSKLQRLPFRPVEAVPVGGRQGGDGEYLTLLRGADDTMPALSQVTFSGDPVPLMPPGPASAVAAASRVNGIDQDARYLATVGIAAPGGVFTTTQRDLVGGLGPLSLSQFVVPG